MTRPVVTQSPDEGWIEWTGGENPVPGQRVEYRCRGDKFVGSWAARPSEDMRWTHLGWDTDIIAYRPVQSDAPAEQGGELPLRSAAHITDMILGALWDYPHKNLTTAPVNAVEMLADDLWALHLAALQAAPAAEFRDCYVGYTKPAPAAPVERAGREPEVMLGAGRGELRPETTSEHIARDMRDGIFPKMSEPSMVPVAAPADPVAGVGEAPFDANATFWAYRVKGNNAAPHCKDWRVTTDRHAAGGYAADGGWEVIALAPSPDAGIVGKLVERALKRAPVMPNPNDRKLVYALVEALAHTKGRRVT